MLFISANRNESDFIYLKVKTRPRLGRVVLLYDDIILTLYDLLPKHIAIYKAVDKRSNLCQIHLRQSAYGTVNSFSGSGRLCLQAYDGLPAPVSRSMSLIMFERPAALKHVSPNVVYFNVLSNPIRRHTYETSKNWLSLMHRNDSSTSSLCPGRRHRANVYIEHPSV